MRHLRNIFNLGIKELRSLLGDKAMLTLIVFSFTVSVYSSATVTPGSLNLAPIAIADMDQSQLSNRIVNSFYRPWFLPPEMITADEMDAGLDAGRYTFAINIPPNFQRDVLAGRQPDIQVNVDATRMSQAFTGNGYIQNIINGEVNSFVARYRDNSEPLVSLETRMRFNPNLDPAIYAWRGAQSVCHYVDRHFYGDDSAFNAATGAAGDSGAAAAANAFRWFHAARKYAADGAGHYADHADDTLC